MGKVYFKVVKVRVEDGDFDFCGVSEPGFEISYLSVGDWIYPKIEGTPLFVFDSYEAACNFVNWDYETILVVEGELWEIEESLFNFADGDRRTMCLGGVFVVDDETIKRWWLNPRFEFRDGFFRWVEDRNVQVNASAFGTVLVKRLRILGVVKDDKNLKVFGEDCQEFLKEFNVIDFRLGV